MDESAGMRRHWPCIAWAVLAGCSPVAAAERIDGPVTAEVVRVIDGDTIEVRARIWLGQAIVVSARVRGIDAPELHGRCNAEATMAAEATLRLGQVAGPGPVRLINIENDKYAGRVIADVMASDGTPVAAEMLASGLVRSYDGGKRQAWCESSSEP